MKSLIAQFGLVLVLSVAAELAHADIKSTSNINFIWSN